MEKKRITAILACAVLGSALALAAQGPPMGPGGPFGRHMEILGFEEMHPGKVVAGAPYSAVSVTEITQTLGDGTTINRKVQSNVYRDSQGRMRRETTLPAFGPTAANGQPMQLVMIHDPVAGTGYILHADTKVAEQLPTHHKGGKGGAAAAGSNADELQGKFEAHIQEEIANGTLKKEDLGTQSIAGISAQGTRYTKTIPAGQIGNDKPITIVSERWYSPDLQVVVKSVRTDPRFGQTTYTLTNVQRAEPAASLFAVPPDYTVKQGHAHGPHGGGPAAPPDMLPPSE